MSAQSFVVSLDTYLSRRPIYERQDVDVAFANSEPLQVHDHRDQKGSVMHFGSRLFEVVNTVPSIIVGTGVSQVAFGKLCVMASMSFRCC